MKKIISMLLIVLMVLSVLCACQPNTEEPKVNEDEVLKILAIGNSHAVNATSALYEVFKREAPDQKVVVGTLYYSGCKLEQHVDFLTYNANKYIYYKNTTGEWEKRTEATMLDALQDEQWDIVVMQEMNVQSGTDTSFILGNIKIIQDYVLENQPATPKFMWHMVWSNPTDEELMNTAPNSDSWKTSYGAYGKDSAKMFREISRCVQQYILTDDTFVGVIPAATAIQYANDLLDMTDGELYRDYTHLSDLAYVMAAYTWYGTIAGVQSFDALKLNVLPVHLRHGNNVALGDLTLTEEQQNMVLEAVNYALKTPYELPAQQ